MELYNDQIAFSQDIIKLLSFVIKSGYEFTFGEAFRTPEQAAIYAKEGKGIVDSLHCQRLALDINLFKNSVYLSASSDYKFLGDYWKSLNPQNHWGGDFPKLQDGNHFERRPL